MSSDPADLTAADHLDGAREMTAANRPYLAHLLAEEVARRTTDPAAAAAIRASFPDPHDRPEGLTAMPARDHFHSVMRIGPVQLGTHRDRRGHTVHAAVCTAERCGWSADYSSRTAAQLAARTHRCRVR